jgi:hypothetical protein
VCFSGSFFYALNFSFWGNFVAPPAEAGSPTGWHFLRGVCNKRFSATLVMLEIFRKCDDVAPLARDRPEIAFFGFSLDFAAE